MDKFTHMNMYTHEHVHTKNKLEKVLPNTVSLFLQAHTEETGLNVPAPFYLSRSVPGRIALCAEVDEACVT